MKKKVRSELITLKVTKAEKMVFKKKSKDYNWSMSSMIRSKILEREEIR